MLEHEIFLANSPIETGECFQNLKQMLNSYKKVKTRSYYKNLNRLVKKKKR
jgi:hypothetical protein